MAQRTQISKMYWEAIYLASTATETSRTPDKPSPNSQTVHLTIDDIDRIKELMNRPSVPTPQDPKLPEQVANMEDKTRFVHPMEWKLSYSKEVEASMRDREKPAPEALPILFRRDESRTAAPRNEAGLPRPAPISETQATSAFQDLSFENQVRVKLARSNKGDNVLNPHHEANVLLQETRDQLDSVDKAHDKLKKSYVDFERAIKYIGEKK